MDLTRIETRSPTTLQDRGFPPELCRHIVQHASSRILPALARVCLAFQVQAEKRLYNTLALNGPANVISMCKLFASCPRVAQYVRALYIYLQNPAQGTVLLRRAPSGALDPSHQRLCLESVTKGLMNTPHLDSLVYVVDWECAISPVSYLLLPDRSPPCFQLTDLKLRCTIDEHLWRFVLAQHKLVSLHIYEEPKVAPGGRLRNNPLADHHVLWPEPDAELLGQWHPPLSSIQGPWTLIPWIIKGRPVQSVKTALPTGQITTQHDLQVLCNCLPRFFQDIGKSTGPLLQLELGDFMPDSLSIYITQLAAKFLPHLTRIGKLMMPLNEQISFMSNMSALNNLRTIEISLAHLRPSPNFMTQAFATQMSVHAEQLSEIVFYLAWEFQRWTKRRGTSLEMGDVPIPYDDWVLVESGRREYH